MPDKGLVVTGGESCLEGCRFKSQHCFLDWTFFHINLLQKLWSLFEKMKTSKKEAGDGPFLTCSTFFCFKLNTPLI